MIFRFGRGSDNYQELRRRMIRETEFALLAGLAAGPRIPRIPTIECGRGTFPPNLADKFWGEMLAINEVERARLTGSELLNPIVPPTE